ncbi:MAG: Crp/Fnr family transcriptional regulator [Epsilonproteobacteria bacterium]|nr:Crp/Fnr family transcriptional regulator [Campylobacterota bacterium]NPA56383.1 Crp/Fnr family transcriptional regulator [Campylobacterota bacterium]
MERLKSFYMFKNLSQAQFKRLKEISKVKEYKKGNILFYEGDRPEHLIVLTEGILQIYKSDPKGNKIILHSFFQPSLIAEIANFERMRYPATAEFITDGKVVFIDYDIFEKEFLKNPEVAFTIIKSLSDKVRLLENVITYDIVLSSTGRVAKFIYDHEEDFLRLKKSEIASIMNITPETLSRIISKFKKLGLLIKEGSGYKVVDKEGLKSFFE